MAEELVDVVRRYLNALDIGDGETVTEERIAMERLTNHPHWMTDKATPVQQAAPDTGTGVRSPAAMAREALELMTRAQVLALAAYDVTTGTMLSKENGLVRIGEARQWVTWLKRDAEAQESKP